MNDSTHNFAGMSLDERAALEIESALEGARARWKQISEATDNAANTITSETEAEDYTTVVAQLQALLKRVDSAHDDVKDPYLNAGRRVDSMTAVLREAIQARKSKLEAALTRYQVEKQRKIEDQRAEERRREEADPEPAFIPHAETDRRRSRVRSVEGASAHLTDDVQVEIVDVTKIPLRYLNRPKVRQALISEIRPDAHKGDEIDGVKVHRGAKSRVKA